MSDEHRQIIQDTYLKLREKFSVRESISIISVTEEIPLFYVCETLGFTQEQLFPSSNTDPDYKYE